MLLFLQKKKILLRGASNDPIRQPDSPAPMSAIPVSGTEGYAEEAEALITQYEAYPFADHHRRVLHLVPPPPADILDIGAGTGRDAGGFAALGHRVVAVEPTEALRTRARGLHPSPAITWLDDSLPDLAVVRDRPQRFDVVMMTAVWMHLDADQRRRAMPCVAELVRPEGVLIMSLRHGKVPAGRRMFEVTGAETASLAAAERLDLVLEVNGQSDTHQRPGITWTRLAFRKRAT